MASESSNVSVPAELGSSEPDKWELLTFPKRSECSTLEEFEEKTKKCYEEHGLRLPTDFSVEEKKAIVDDCTVNLIDPKVLSQKYNTTVFAVRHFVYEKGLKLAPPDLSKYPDFPKKSDDISSEEYQEILKKYWKARKKRLQRANKQKAKSEIKADEDDDVPPSKMDRGGIPKEYSPKKDIDLSSVASNMSAIANLQDFPQRSQCMSQEEYQEKSKNYYDQLGLRVLLGLKVKALNEEPGLPLSPDLSRYPDFPLKKDNITIEEFEEIVNKFLKDKKKGKEKRREKERLKQQRKRKRREERKIDAKRGGKFGMNYDTIMNY